MSKRIIVYDLDDTLIRSSAKIKIYDAETNEVVSSMTPSEFNYHVKNQSHYLSFEEFNCEKILGNASIIPRTFRSLKRYISKGVPVSIVTARESKKMVMDFFRSKGVFIFPSLVFAVHDSKASFHGSIAERKKQAISLLIAKGYNDIVMYEDNLDNIRAVESLRSDKVKIRTVHVFNEEEKGD